MAVFSYDVDAGGWVQVPATVSADGTVRVSQDHLTLYAVFVLPKVTRTLERRLNAVTFTGATGTAIADFVGTLGSGVESVSRFNPQTQLYDSYIVGAPPLVNSLRTLTQGDAIFVNAYSGHDWTETDIVPPPRGRRTVTLVPGLNAFGFAGADDTDPASLIAGAAGVVSIARYDATTQSWQTYVPGAPAFANTLTAVNRLDALYLRLTGLGPVPISLEVVSAS